MPARRRKLFFDERGHDPDLVDVLEAAAILQLSEFELFRAAHRWWCGRNLSDKEVEVYFLPYMFGGHIPPWVRQFARTVLDAEADDALNPRDFGVLPRPVSKSAFDRGVRYCLWLVVIMACFMTMIIAYERLAPLALGCIVPPCY